MTFHIVLPRPLRLRQVVERSRRRECPRHGMAVLANELDAQIHEPDDAEHPQGLDRLRNTVLPAGALWNLARRVKERTGPADSVFLPSEAGGLQFAAVSTDRRRRPRTIVFAHNLDRPRARLAMKWWHLRDRVDLFLACSQRQVDFLREFLQLPADRVRHVWDHTDTRFFTPGPVSPDKTRPLVVSVGLEKRDYRTLAAATADLPVDVRISGFSEDAAAIAESFPPELPENMTRRFYSWPELVQLYRDADVVVVSCHENDYAAGVQSLMEASACGRPVIATATRGLASYLDERVVGVPPGDAAAMRRAIVETLADPQRAAARGDQGRAVAMRRYDLDRYVAEIGDVMREH